MNDWRKPCEHGRYEAHRKPGHEKVAGAQYCDGGSPITVADILEAAQALTLLPDP